MKPGLLLLLLLLPPPGPPGHCRLASGHSLPGKYGECPPPSGTPLKSCDSFCSSDGDCPGSERCCSTGCGRECRLPAGAKRGFCPRPKPGLVTICLVECGSDSECRGSGKCCSMGCHVRCTQPVPAKPGVCPKRRVLHTFAPCNSSCSDDTDCPRREKCCFTGCGRSCLPPDKRITARHLPAGWDHLLGPAASKGPVSSGDICHLPPVRGPCRGLFHHYAYNPATGTCQPFIYSGCGGNANNFRTVEECQQVCQQVCQQLGHRRLRLAWQDGSHSRTRAWRVPRSSRQQSVGSNVALWKKSSRPAFFYQQTPMRQHWWDRGAQYGTGGTSLPQDGGSSTLGGSGLREWPFSPLSFIPV